MNAPRASVVGRDVIVKGPGFTITIRPDTVPPPANDAATPAPADGLEAYPFGLERQAATRLIQSGELPTRRIGRKVYARRSDLLALVTRAAAPPPLAPPALEGVDELARVRAGRRAAGRR
jgi:hypothetical protein